MEQQKEETTLQKALKLKQQGLTGKAIAEQLGVTQGRISQLIGTRKKKIEVPVEEQSK